MYLITGAAGFIGSHVAEALLKNGESVIGIDNFNDYYNPAFKEENVKILQTYKQFALYRADITDFPPMRKIFEKHQSLKVVHLAARAGVRPSIQHPLVYQRVNGEGTLNLLELSKQYKAKQFIFGSSSSVYGANQKVPFSESDRVDNPLSPYAATKKAGELLCYAYASLHGIPITCLRFFTVYGPRGRPDMAPYLFTKNIMEGKAIEMYGDGSSQRDYTYVADVVQGILASLDKEFPFEIINIGGSNPVELTRFISLIEKNTGKKASIMKKPMQQGDVPCTYADITKARKLLHYNPKVKIEEGIQRFVEWYKASRV